MHDAEDGGSRSDAQRQREDSQQDEARIPGKGT
jgi:hypothetical protein